MSLTTQLLGQFHPFSQLAPEYLDRIAEHSETVTVAKGKLVFQRGKNLSHLFYLLEGEVNLVDASFQTTTLSAESDASHYALNEINPSKTSAVAATEVAVLAVNRRQLDLVMAASEAGPELPIDADPAAADMVTAQINYLDAYAYPQHVEVDSGGQQDWMSRLLDSPLFHSVPAGNIQQLFSRFESIGFMRGQRVVEEGEPGDYFYVIASGRAQVATTKGEQILLECGDYFGEEALVGDTTRNATITMESDGELMRLAKEDFVKLLQEPLFRYVEFDQLTDMGPQVEILDVRLPVEHRHISVRGSRNIALNKLRANLKSLDPGLTYIVTDDGGSRSKVAVQLLIQRGLSAAILTNSDRAYH
ncbi:cyclic nucleotide-binding domain-containing protein [Halioxenophilus sp. WMMB6]|uniref:cyclic nucleotide-binding domain-containing protein n=1 Tax=Halioxenophilus sp. WMMB6 TaxID=3073815 RepID=UPI00295EA670|nr:cyclic nucleotide-binding domain-containing protein [Halioxenophilus sp. WMMB6]